MRVIIVGGGEVGFALAQALSARHDVVVIDHAAQAGDRFEPLDVEFVSGGGTSADTLRAAGVERADVFIGCTGLDEVNIVACAMANQFGSPQTICFVSREDFLSAGGQQGLERFGINRVIWPEAQLAADIARIVAAPGAIDAEEFAGGAVRLLEYRLEAGSQLTTGAIADLGLPHGSLLVAVRRGDSFFIPRGDSQLLPGDKAIIMGTPAAMEEVQRRLAAQIGTRSQFVTIIGGGDVGMRLAEGLDAAPGVQLRVIERDRARGELLAGRLRRALVLNGDGTDLELLESEDIGRSDVLVSVIDNDEKNLLASLLGRQLGVRRIITRVSKRANLRLFERVGVDVAISARGAAVASVLHQIEGGPSSLLAVLEQGEGRIIELQVPAGFRARPLRDLEAPRDSIIGAILRDGGAIVPRGDDRLEPGDRVLVFSTPAAAERVRDYFRTSGS
ncbi:MAG TPA: Trk system potassium transporter TrkA [Vicinamibacterales bacterium]|nr:Trk system potassium transporter TrkA [Vicinamibacterales bacterium]